MLHPKVDSIKTKVRKYTPVGDKFIIVTTERSYVNAKLEITLDEAQEIILQLGELLMSERGWCNVGR